MDKDTSAERPARLRQIARVLGLREDYFLTGGRQEDMDRKLDEILRLLKKAQ